MNSVFPFSSRLLIRFSSIPVSHLQLSGGPPLRRLACPCRAGRCCYTSPVEYNHYPAPFPPGLPSLDSPSLIVQPSLFFHYSVHASHLFRGQWMPALKDAAGMTRIVRLRQTMRPLPLDGMHAIELKEHCVTRVANRTTNVPRLQLLGRRRLPFSFQPRLHGSTAEPPACKKATKAFQPA